MITRRRFVQGLGTFTAGVGGLGGYAFGIEPRQVSVAHYALTPPRWPAGLTLRIAVLADIHACDPWMTGAHIEDIVSTANSLKPDLIALLGDFKAGHKLPHRELVDRDWTAPLTRLRAPLGVHAVLGNHDWWDDIEAQKRGGGVVKVRRALEEAGVPVYENDTVRLVKNGQPFWLSGLGDQWAIWYGIGRRSRSDRFRFRGMHDLPRTLAPATDTAPLILLVHEPDIFPEVPERVSLTLAGHTHGGQINLFGFTPVVPSRYGSRYVYGHIVEPRPDAGAGAEPRHMIVSAGLGCSGLPVRFMAPPEVALVDVGA